LEELNDEKEHTDIPAYSMYDNNGRLWQQGDGCAYANCG
jgi:hypothetical protein